MAIHTFKNAGSVISTANTDAPVYQAPPGKQSLVHSLTISNLEATENIQATITVTTDSGVFTILKKAIITPSNSLVWDKVINLEADDFLKVQTVGETVPASCNANVFASVLEIQS
jgi:hypothetical protein